MTFMSKFAYRLGWPLGRVFARFGLPAVIRIEAIHDDEAGVFVATSPDVRGLVIEADTLEEVANEVRLVLPDLLGFENAGNVPPQTSIRLATYSPASA